MSIHQAFKFTRGELFIVKENNEKNKNWSNEEECYFNKKKYVIKIINIIFSHDTM